MPRFSARAVAMPRHNLPLMLGAAVLAAGAVMTAAPALAQQAAPANQTILVQPETPTLNLSAYGEVRAAPDKAMITFGVQTEATTAAEAMAQNRTRMNQVMQALRRAGIEERYIQTSGLNLSPQYDYVQNEPPRLRGYQAINRVTVEIRDLDRVGSTADAVVNAGVNQIDGISFGLINPQQAEDQARMAAVQALQARANLYANALGVRLAGIRNLSEGGGYSPQPPQPMFARTAMAMDSAESTSVAPGELTVRVNISGVYDIVR
ncbi:MAG: SIMPL domain-containing protein [Brevundimonas sp.]|uniref:SIMPL domain-containing protein n=1 Tax=Brevundimonas sp. TaxID=1871086 RepID=UPI00391B1055